MISFRLIMDKAAAGETIEVWGDPSRSKEMLYVKDLAKLFGQTIESDIEGGIYNVGGQTQVTLEEQINGIIDVYSQGKKSNKVYCPNKPNALFNHLDITRTIQELGYHPDYSYIEWLKDFKEEQEKNRFKLLWGIREDYE